MGLRQGVLSGDTGPVHDEARPARGATDAELIAGVARNDAHSFDELLRRHWKPVVCYAAALVDADTAEDVAQETFLRMSSHAAEWRPLGQVRTFLLHIARNLALNERRRQQNRLWALGRARPQLMARSVPTPCEVLEESELRCAIQRAVEAMPERRREAFALVRFGGLSYREAAAVMGTSEQTVANQLTSALADLRRAIEPFADETP
jgi:RNA polymerase sigma-70 factor (ECF subfamily)